MAVTSFELGKKVFIAFANYRGFKDYLPYYRGYKSSLPVYVFHQHNFTLNQTLVSFGATDVEYFSIHGDHFLAVANHYNGRNSNLDSVVLYRLEAGKF